MTHADVFESTTSLSNRLSLLRAEHQELDDHIARLLRGPQRDELMVPRLKKRKLILHDRIALIERMLNPDLPA
ncbi:MAG: YdcH family protein [Rhodocyclaceae bacterium]